MLPWILSKKWPLLRAMSCLMGR
ncbi:hypothetical protein LEMLEM_LOCUS4642 [Lemmus lemmus]